MSSFLSAISALNRSGVRYVAVGGFASVMHGNNRFTSDIDVVVDPDPEETLRAVRSLVASGLKTAMNVPPDSFADLAFRSELRSKGERFFGFFDPANPTFGVDLFVDSPKDFEALFGNSVSVSLRGEPCRICSLDDLIEMKRAAGRTQDQLDLSVLLKLKESGKGAK